MNSTNVPPRPDEEPLVESIRSASAENLLSMHKAHLELAAALQRLGGCNQERESLRSENDELRRLVGRLRFDLDECRLQLTRSQNEAMRGPIVSSPVQR
jgi:hypothetical protein